MSILIDRQTTDASGRKPIEVTDKPAMRVPLNICLFLVTGRTFSFKDVNIESDNETAVTFYYRAMSDGARKKAVFFKTALAGIAYHNG